MFDGTFGSPGAAPTDPSGTTFLIDQSRGGTVSTGGRTHLFHSFDQFGVPLARAAEFRTDDAVDTILARVTGLSPSLIDGDLRVRNASGVGGPDLFLMNPNGVIFGGASRLDMAGAFLVTTASSIGFADGARFSVDPAAPLPTTAALPTTLHFEDGIGGDVEITGRVLSTGSGGQATPLLTIVGRNVRATGQSFLAPQQATVQIGAVGDGAFDVPLDLAAQDGTALGGSILVGGGPGQSFTIATSSPGADQGRIVIRGGELVVDSGRLLAGGDGTGAAPAIDIEVAGDVRVQGTTGRIESLTSGGFGPGTLRISADRLDVSGGASVEITTNGAGAGVGRIEVDVDTLAVDGAFSQLRSSTSQAGQGGAIDVRAREVALTSSGRILSETLTGASGSGGAISVSADAVTLDGQAAILSATNGPGRAGNVEVRAGSLVARDFSQVTSGSSGTGAGGDVGIAVETLSLLDSSLIATGPLPIAPGAQLGPAGAVRIEAGSVLVDGGSQISATTGGAGAAGDVTLVVRDALVVRGARAGVSQPSGIFARSGLAFGSPATGDGGSITIDAGRIEVSEGAEIGSQTFGPGRAGSVDLRATDSIVLRGGRIAATSTDVGVTGDIRIRAGDEVRLAAGAEIRSDAPIARPDPGSAGDIEIGAGRLVRIEDSRIATDSARPETGDVRLFAGSAIAIVASDVTTNVDTTSGRGGDIAIAAGAVGLAGAVVTANAQGLNSNAGNVLVVGRSGIVRSTDTRVEARAELGIAGEVVLAAPDTNVTADITVLDAEYRDPADAIEDPCRARESRAGSFAIRAAPPAWSPDQPLRVDEEAADGAGAADDCVAP